MTPSSVPATSRVLVVGAGVCGLGTAWRLAQAGTPVLVVEARGTPGGNAVSVRHEGVSVDPGFGIFGGPPYPNFMQLLRDLGVESRALGPMEEYVTRHHPGGGPGWNSLGSIPYARHVIPEMHRFVRELAPRLVDDPTVDGMSIGEVLKRAGFSPEFACYVLVGGLMVGFGGHPLDYYLGYPARDFVRSAFFPGTHQPLLRLTRGASDYVDRFVAALRATGLVELRCGATTCITARDGRGVTAAIDGRTEAFAAVVVTAMPSQALGVLGDTADPDTRAALGRFSESDDEVLIHRDESVLPPDRSPRSFAYLAVPRPADVGRGTWHAVATRRWQSNDDGDTPGYVTHDYRAGGRLRPRGARSLVMSHVRYELATMEGRSRVAALQGQRSTWFAGGYLRGQMLHEDALVSGYEAAAGILGHRANAPILVRGAAAASDGVSAPLPLDAFAEVLRRWPDRALFTWLDGLGDPTGVLTAAELDRGSRAVAAALAARGVRPGDRALLVYPPGLEFVVGLLGCLRAGVVAVPVYPPPLTGRDGVAAFEAIADDCDPAVALTCASFRAPALLAQGRQAARQIVMGSWRRAALPWIPTDRLDAVPDAPLAVVGADDVALLQYTSGSTGTPRGVMITHGNLRHQLDAVSARGVGITADSVLLWWVPQYHDFGLISGIFAALGLGARSYVFSPLDFIRRPASWLAAASRYRATHTAAPDFAFALTAARTTPAEAEALDLRSLEVMMSAGEPVSPEHVDAFARRFAAAGLSPDALCPAYGLAEHTVGVSVRGRRSLHVDRAALEGERRVRRGAHCLVGCGRPVAGVSVAIVDPGTGRRCASGEVGEIWVDSASRAGGYWRRPDESRSVFGARLTGDPADRAWLRTGDEGFLHDDEIFVTGRLKDLVVVRGRNLHPQDVEATVERHFAEVRRGRVAAFGLSRPGGEALGVAVELRDPKPADPAGLAAAIASRIAAEHGVGPAVVALVAPGSVPKTTSGKVQRRRCRERLEAGALRVIHRLEPSGVAEVGQPAAPGADTKERLARLVYERTRARLDADDSLAAVGAVDSMAAVELIVAIQDEFALPGDWIADITGTTLGEVARAVDALAAAGAGRDAGLVVLREGDERAPVFLVAPLFLGAAALAKLGAAFGRDRTVLGLLNDGGCEDAAELARAHVRRVVARQPEGPWNLAGYSYGGAVVHLMARLLEEHHGRGPARVFLLDPQLADGAGDRDRAGLARMFLRAVGGAHESNAPEAGALPWFQRLVDPAGDAGSLARYLDARAAELASLSAAPTMALARRRLDAELVLFRAQDAATQRSDFWGGTYGRVEVVEVPRDHYRLLESSSAIASVIEARLDSDASAGVR